MKILHIIGKANDAYAWQAVWDQQKKQRDHVLILLIHDGVFDAVKEGENIYAVRDDVMAREVEARTLLVGYEEMVTMLMASDSVVCW